LGTEGRWFESSLPDHFSSTLHIFDKNPHNWLPPILVSIY